MAGILLALYSYINQQKEAFHGLHMHRSELHVLDILLLQAKLRDRLRFLPGI